MSIVDPTLCVIVNSNIASSVIMLGRLVQTVSLCFVTTGSVCEMKGRCWIQLIQFVRWESGLRDI